MIIADSITEYQIEKIFDKIQKDIYYCRHILHIGNSRLRVAVPNWFMRIVEISLASKMLNHGENKYEALFGAKIVPCIANQIYVFDIDADMHDELMEPIKIEITSTKSIAISNY